jgi:hypothetical protein
MNKYYISKYREFVKNLCSTNWIQKSQRS